MQKQHFKRPRFDGDVITNKDASVEAATVLRGPILQHVLGLVGPGEWRFVAEVSSEFMTTYRQVALTQPFGYLFDQEMRLAEDFVLREEKEDKFWCLCPKTVFCEPQHTTYAARFASASRMEATFKDGLKLTPNAMFSVGLFGDVEVLNSLNIGGKLGVHKAAGVAASSSIEKLQWFSDHCLNDSNQEEIVNQMLRVSARAGNLQVFEWVWNRYGTGLAEAEIWYLEQLARVAGKSDLCKLLRKYDRPWDPHCIEQAVVHGQHELVFWMLSTLNETPIWVGELAAANGHIAILETLFAHSAYRGDLIGAAGYGNHKEVVQWLRAQGVNWPSGLAFNGKPWSAEMVEWAREQGCDSAMVSRNDHDDDDPWVFAAYDHDDVDPWDVGANGHDDDDPSDVGANDQDDDDPWDVGAFLDFISDE
eukprot:3936-Heterococcus_DN1.PRE.1